MKSHWGIEEESLRKSWEGTTGRVITSIWEATGNNWETAWRREANETPEDILEASGYPSGILPVSFRCAGEMHILQLTRSATFKKGLTGLVAGRITGLLIGRLTDICYPSAILPASFKYPSDIFPVSFQYPSSVQVWTHVRTLRWHKNHGVFAEGVIFCLPYGIRCLGVNSKLMPKAEFRYGLGIVLPSS